MLMMVMLWWMGTIIMNVFVILTWDSHQCNISLRKNVLLIVSKVYAIISHSLQRCAKFRAKENLRIKENDQPDVKFLFSFGNTEVKLMVRINYHTNKMVILRLSQQLCNSLHDIRFCSTDYGGFCTAVSLPNSNYNNLCTRTGIAQLLYSTDELGQTDNLKLIHPHT